MRTRAIISATCVLSLEMLLAPWQPGLRADERSLDFSGAVVVTAPELTGPANQAVRLLVEEVKQRTQITLRVAHQWPPDPVPVIVVGKAAQIAGIAGPPSNRPALGPPRDRPEGFSVEVRSDGPSAAAFVLAGDDRGVLFGVGRLLREMRMFRGKLLIPAGFQVSTAPRYALRGHQMGYRPKTNSYDGWTPAIWEQYIRDLIVFGTNAVELIPPRSDDAPDSPHFPLPQIEMMKIVSGVLDKYGLDVWIWYPAMDRDYADPATVEFALKEWGEVFRQLPRVDAVFVPGGDPGHTAPRILLALLEKQTRMLQHYHPRAQMWVSPQSFDRKWLEEFYRILSEEKPAWLSGVVYGPQVGASLPEVRAAIPSRYPIRHYPDITHSLKCQYPVPDWDLAYALTEAREVINPRPVGEAGIFRLLQKDTTGFIAYSEGCNDDVNKIVWSALGWDPDLGVKEILRQYSRYFLGPRYEESFAEGLLALERNWQGPLAANEPVDRTLEQFMALERAASPQDLLNWRFQQALYRAYYDAYQRRRLLHENELEQAAMDELRSAQHLGSDLAISRAQDILNRAEPVKPAPDWRARIFELAEALYQSIRMQLSVERYKAIAVGRGANLDTVDMPLNNQRWLKQRLSALGQMGSEADRLRGIEEIVNWTNPGPGGFYDELGSPAARPHLVPGAGFEKDPAFFATPLTGFAYESDWRLSWCRHAEALYDAPLRMRYTDLDPKGRYVVRVVYAGENPAARIRLIADEAIELHPYLDKPRPVRPLQFEVPEEATRDGNLTLTWQAEPGRGGNGRACQVAEVWLELRGQSP